MMLEDKESMLVETIMKSVVKNHRKEWRFTEALRKRGAWRNRDENRKNCLM
jgi:hypothetical protein